MGKQVNFYMSAEDEKSFIDFLREDPEVKFLSPRSPTVVVESLASLPRLGDWAWWSIVLWNQGISPPPVMSFIESQNYFTVNKLLSEVIEFDRSTKDEERLVRGRIFADLQFWSTEQPVHLIKKGIEFIEWFESLGKWLKGQSTRNKYGEYVMPGAQAFVASGGRLTRSVRGSAREL